MRNYSFTPAAQVVATARATFTDRRLQFVNQSISDTPILGYYDAATNGSNILRVGSAANIFQYENWVPGSTPSWTAGWALNTGSRPGQYGLRTFYQKPDFSLAYWDHPYSGGPTTFYTPALNTRHAIAPVSATEMYIMWMHATGGDHQIVKLAHLTTAGALTTWEGRIYGEVDFTTFDARRFGGADYLYYSDYFSRRTNVIRIGDAWGPPKQVFPMDIVDDLSKFYGGHAAVFNSEIFYTGILKRNEGPTMHVYTKGPEHYTAGRDMFIALDNAETAPVPGKLHLIGGDLWYVGPDIFYKAAATEQVGYSNPSKTLTTQAFGTMALEFRKDASYVLSNLTLDDNVAAVGPGYEGVLEVSLNGSWYKLGTIDVDNFSRDQGERGQVRGVTGRSNTLKRLEQWQADVFYDYWSQTYQDSDPVELTELIRATGTWEPAGTGLTLATLNVDGFLYAVSRPTENNLVRAKFKPLAGTYSADFGPGLNFYQESKWDASQRLGVEISEVEDDQIGAHGIFAVYGATQHSGGPGIGLYRVVLGVFNKLTSWSVSFTAGLEYWLQLQYYHGVLTVAYRLSTNTTWTNVGTYTYESTAWLPHGKLLYNPSGEDNGLTLLSGRVIHDPAGRGALYLRNTTPNSQCFYFNSLAEVVPVLSVAPFPTADTVVVDREKITYSGKSANTLQGPLLFSSGAPVTEYTTIGGSEQAFGGTPDPNALRTSFTGNAYLTGAEVYVKKTGNPRDLSVRLYRDPVGGANPLGQLLAHAEIPAEEIGTTFAWHKVEFSAPVAVQTGDYLVMHQVNPEVESPTNYFATRDGGNYTGGNAARFNDDLDVWTTLAGDLPFKLYGSTTLPPEGAYAIHVTGAPNVGATAFNTMALCVTDGTGKNGLYNIVGYSYAAAAQTIFVDTRPWNLDTDSIMYIAPVLYVTSRGAAGTIATSHSKDTVVSVDASALVEVSRFQMFSGEQDLSLAEFTKELARRAGGKANDATLVDGTVQPPMPLAPAAPFYARRNFIVELGNDSYTWNADEVGVFGGYDGVSAAWILTVSNWRLRLYDGSATLLEEYQQGVTGTVKISVHDNHVSVWSSGKHLHSFVVAPYEGDQAGLCQTGTLSLPVRWSEADLRIDNFVFDMGIAGTQLLKRLIGEKRIYFRDDANGDLYLFGERETVPGTYTFDYMAKHGETNSILVTRVRVEGAEVHEKLDEDLAREHGNLFATLNAQEVNDEYDARRVAEKYLEDSASYIKSTSLVGHIDPRLEPEDVFTTNQGALIAESVGIRLSINPRDMLAEMTVNARWPKSAL